MLGEILEALFEGLEVGGGKPSRGVQIFFRLLFGGIGLALGVAGAVHFGGDPTLTDNLALRGAFVALMAGVAAVSLFNVAFVRRWRWPLWLTGLALAGCFVARFAGGP